MDVCSTNIGEEGTVLGKDPTATKGLIKMMTSFVRGAGFVHHEKTLKSVGCKAGGNNFTGTLDK